MTTKTETRTLTNPQIKFRVFFNSAIDGQRCRMTWYAASAKACRAGILELVGEHDHYLELFIIPEIFAIRGDA